MLDIISETALVASRPPRDTLSGTHLPGCFSSKLLVVSSNRRSNVLRLDDRQIFPTYEKSINLSRGAPSKVTIAERMRVLYGFAVFSIEKKRREVVLSTPLSSSRGKCRLFTSNLGNNLQERREIWRMGALFGDTLDEHNVTGHWK